MQEDDRGESGFTLTRLLIGVVILAMPVLVEFPSISGIDVWRKSGIAVKKVVEWAYTDV